MHKTGFVDRLPAALATPLAGPCTPPLTNRLREKALRTVLAASLPMLAIPACSSPPDTTGQVQTQPGTCLPSQLAFSLDDGNGRFNGMSHSGTEMVLRNTGKAACMIPPRPVPRFTDADHQPLDIIARAAPENHAAPATRPIMLKAAASVTSDMRWVSGNVYTDGHCESPAFLTLAIGRQMLSTAFAGHLCGAAGKASTFTLTPLQPAASARPESSP